MTEVAYRTDTNDIHIVDLDECVGDCSNDGSLPFTEGSSTEEVTYGQSTADDDRTAIVSINQMIATTTTTVMTSSYPLNNILDIVNDPKSNSTEKDKAFRDFLDHVGLGPEESSNTTNRTLNLRVIDEFLEKINGTIESSVNDVDVWAYPLNASNDNLIGIVVNQSDDRANVTTNTKNETLDSLIRVGTIVDHRSIQDINHMAVIFIKNTLYFDNLVSLPNMIIASSIAIVDLKPKIHPSFVRLFFQNSLNKSMDIHGEYRCAFFNHTTSAWDDSGCEMPQYNSTWDRFECVCNHQTPFSLLWKLKVSKNGSFQAQSITSSVFLSISILSFLVVIIHSVLDQITNSIRSLPASDLLSLLSVGNTMLVFVMFLVSTLVANLQKPSSNSTSCSSSSYILGFALYFFVLLMFCTKTSVGYFNYVRFVRLFPESSLRTMILLLVCSFFIALLAVCSAIGVHLHTSVKVLELHQETLCWFNQNVLHYFLTIPISLFLVINMILLVFVIRNIRKHVRNASSTINLKKRRAKCITVLLCSAITQGIGWLFGPAMTIGPESMQVVFSWIFYVCNALEGFWIIILYLLFRSQKLHISKLVRVRRALFQNKQKDIHDRIIN